MAGNENDRAASIMVVDDDQRNVRLMESILRSNGYRVQHAFNGLEAKQLIETEEPDLLLLDVMMPKMNGFELCRALRETHRTRLLPIIMITALNALEDKVQALETGADEFLSKPVNKTELLAKVRSILRVKTLQDEVERQRLELEATNRQLVEMQGFKESMTQMIVHDLKNPLAGIMGNIQLMQLQSQQMEPERMTKLLERTLESGREMTRMIINILEIGKLEEQKMPLRIEPVSIHRSVAEALSEMTSLCARDNISVANQVDPGLPAVGADRRLIGRVLANLLTNAFKHTPAGGQVSIEAKIDADEMILSICDNGDGIPEELQPHIFEKFVGGNSGLDSRRMHDSGLGLTFCRLAVERHGGRIWLTSRSGQGTAVFVALPCRASEEPESANPDRVPGVRAA